RSHRGGDRQHRFRHLHPGQILRRHGPGHRISHRSRSLRAPGHAQQGHNALAAEEGHPLHPDLRPAGLQDRGQVQVLGRPHSRGAGGGPGLVASHTNIAKKQGITIAYNARALSLIVGDDGVTGVRVKHDGHTADVAARCVVLAAGGFQANTEMRTRYLGPGWELAKIRGTRFNTGDGIRMAMDIGAMPTGNWSGCHAVGWDRNAPEFGDLAVGDNFQKHSYPWGIMLNADGERFVDEGADFRNYTYAKYGRVILMQPGQFAWQVFDAKIIPMLRDEYRIKQVTKVRAARLEELVNKLDDVNAERALATIKAYNKAVRTDVPFNPNVKDGRR